MEKFSLVTVEPARESRSTKPPRLRLQWWIWEICSAGISVAAFGLMVVILRAYDGHSLPELPDKISLNTIVALLGTVSKTTLLLVASAAISQLKWLWVHDKPRKLRDLEIFDEASRGPWGALLMLQHSRKSVASLGALVVLLLLAFDPLVQQIITTPQRDLSILAESSTLNRALSFDQSAEINAFSVVKNTVDRLRGNSPVRTMESTIVNGASSVGMVPDFTPACPTANCTWPTFHSLGLCNTCWNVTDYARQNWECLQNDSAPIYTNNRDCNYNLPNTFYNYEYIVFNNGTYHEVGGEMRQAIWTTQLNRTTYSNNTFLVISQLVLEETGILVAGPAREQVREATECVLSMCITENDLSVTNGVTNHTIISTEQPFGMYEVSGSATTTHNGVMEAEVGDATYHVDVGTTLPFLVTFINETLGGTVTADYINDTTPGSRDPIDGDLSPSSTLSSDFYAGLEFPDAVENMANSVSQYVRGLSDNVVVGTAHNLESFIKVQWAWITFPAVLIACGIALLLLAVAKTERSGVEVWKSSSLPLWFHGHRDNAYQRSSFVPSAVGTVEEMEAEAAQIQVRLGRYGAGGGGGWMLWAEQRGRNRVS